MVQGPCAHVVLHDRIYVDFTFLLTVINYWEVIRHQTQHSRLYSYWICTKFQVNCPSGYKMCPASANPDKLLSSVTLKSWSNQKPGDNVMCPYYRRCTHDNNLEPIQSLVQELYCSTFCVFSFGPQESDRTEIWSVRSSDRGVHNVPRFTSLVEMTQPLVQE
jgi:hypothetical protein